MISLLLFMVLGGLVIGALGRLVVPGRNPIGLLRTILFGLAGSFPGGLVARLVLGWRYGYSGGLAFVLAIAFTAAIVYLTDGRKRRRQGTGTSAFGARPGTWR